MLTALVIVFVIAYGAIALEQPLKINKSAPALLGAWFLWTIYAVMSGNHTLIEEQLGQSLASTAQIVFFLIGAMTIVEVVDAHNGFDVITSRIKNRPFIILLWLVGMVTFFLSSVLDNLTTTIVMISMMRKLLERREDRLLFAGIIVIAANTGGGLEPHRRRNHHHALDRRSDQHSCHYERGVYRLGLQHDHPAGGDGVSAAGQGRHIPGTGSVRKRL